MKRRCIIHAVLIAEFNAYFFHKFISEISEYITRRRKEVHKKVNYIFGVSCILMKMSKIIIIKNNEDRTCSVRDDYFPFKTHSDVKCQNCSKPSLFIVSNDQ